MRYEGQEFRNQTLILDGNSYVGCTIENCALKYSGTTEIDISNCRMGANEFVYAGYAAITVQTLQAIACNGAGGLDHVMRLLVGNVPIDWHKVVEIGALPEKAENPAVEEKPQTETQRRGITIRWRGTHVPKTGDLQAQNERRGSPDQQTPAARRSRPPA